MVGGVNLPLVEGAAVRRSRGAVARGPTRTARPHCSGGRRAVLAATERTARPLATQCGRTRSHCGRLVHGGGGQCALVGLVSLVGLVLGPFLRTTLPVPWYRIVGTLCMN